MAGYDEYVEGVEAEETTSLDTPLQEVRGYKLIDMFCTRAIDVYILQVIKTSGERKQC